jgi:hypothetical protein
MGSGNICWGLMRPARTGRARISEGVSTEVLVQWCGTPIRERDLRIGECVPWGEARADGALRLCGIEGLCLQRNVVCDGGRVERS